ncbi:hypothetical protein LTR84_000238 [Exophiala bonariae]|uniref:Uncharacterized protein n=1 Tax=Exophiala bonariae TaxID=1690606 RepID=A0AAV9NQH6_9EURO|nr:hypothetical protein LTR84_000238 [Exophiala bonariae]
MGAYMADAVKKSLKDPVTYKYLKSVKQGAATTVYAVLSKEWKVKGGRFLSDCLEQKPLPDDKPWKSTAHGDGYTPRAFSLEAVDMEDDLEGGKL